MLLAAGPVGARDFQLWNNASVQGSVSGELLFTADTSVRFTDDATRWSQTVVRGGLGWRASSRLTLWGGYAHVRARLPGDRTLVEHRIWQQASYPILGGPRARLHGRTRLEQRWLEGGDGTAWRFRQQLRLVVPLGGKPQAPGLVVAQEWFWHLEGGGSGVFREGADQGRTLIGLGVPLGPEVRIEPAWMRQRLEVLNPDRVNDVVQITLTVAL